MTEPKLVRVSVGWSLGIPHNYAIATVEYEDDAKDFFVRVPCTRKPGSDGFVTHDEAVALLKAVIDKLQERSHGD